MKNSLLLLLVTVFFIANINEIQAEFKISFSCAPTHLEQGILNDSFITTTIDPDTDPFFNRSMLRNPSTTYEYLVSSSQMGSREILSFTSSTTNEKLIFDSVVFER